MWFIGDVHGRFSTYLWTINKMLVAKDRGISYAQDVDDLPISIAKDIEDYSLGNYMDCSLQIGDMGIFEEDDLLNIPESENHKFFRGNHDNPQLCNVHANYLVDYGYFEKQDMFVLSGGYSIDWEWRVAGSTWWEDEELSQDTLNAAIEQFSDSKPKIMVSHECPTIIKPMAITNDEKIDISSRTELALERMFQNHKPDIWIFGHHHKRIDEYGEHTGNVRFICLNEMISGPVKECIFEIPGLSW